MKLTYVLLLAIALAINVNAQGKEQAVPLTTAEEAASKSDEQKGADAAAAAEGKTAEGLQPVGCPLRGGTFGELNAVGSVLAGQGSFQAAEACFIDAVQTTIPTFQALTELSDLRQDYVQSSARSGIIESLAGTAQARLFHSQHLIMAGRHPEAVPRLRVLAENNKDVANVHHLYANALYNSGLREEGIEALNNAIKLMPENEGYKNDLEALQKDFEEYKKAVADAEAKAAEEKK